MEDVAFYVGIPPVTVRGVHSLRAYREQSKAKLFPSLAQGGAFVSNRNLNGLVQVILANESPAHALMQVFDLSGIGFPIKAEDAGTAGGSSFIRATSCRVINTPKWMKSERSDFVTYLLACKNLIISGGIRKQL